MTIVSLTLLINMYLYQQLKQQQRRNHYLQHQLDLLQAPLTKLQDLLQKREMMIAHLQILSALNQQRQQKLKLFNNIITILPATAYLNTIEDNTLFLRLSGRATDQMSITKILKQLKDFSWLTTPEFIINKNTQQGIYQYDFTIKLHRG